MKISEMITDRYKLRIPPTVYYDLLADVREAEEEQEPKTGHWIKGYTFPDGEYWKCDKCNELIKVKYPMNYCNNCGSDNREVEDGNE